MEIINNGETKSQWGGTLWEGIILSWGLVKILAN